MQFMRFLCFLPTTGTNKRKPQSPAQRHKRKTPSPNILTQQHKRKTPSLTSSDSRLSLTPSEPEKHPLSIATTATASSQPQLRKTAKNAFRLVLTNLGPISKFIPPPAGLALGSTAEVVLHLMDAIDGIDDNNRNFTELGERIERLSGLIVYAKENQKDDQVISQFANELKNKLSELEPSADQIPNQSLLAKLLNSGADKLAYNAYVTSLDSLVGDFSLAIGVKTLENTEEIREDTGKIIVGMGEIKAILHNWLQTQEATPPSSGLTARPPGSGVWGRLYSEFVKSGDWKEIDCSIESEVWKGGTYVFSSKIDPNLSTEFQLEVLSFHIKWSVRTPLSFWYPGTHSGYLEIPTDYPFKPPKLYFETPIFSPNLTSEGFPSVDMIWNKWSAGYKIKDLMDVVTFMLTVDPIYRSEFSDKLPRIPLFFHDCNYRIANYVGETDLDAFQRATNFFARAYTNYELPDDPTVTLDEIAVSEKVVVELLEFFTHRNTLNDPPEGSTSNDPSTAFRSLEGKQISDLLKEERRWADVLAPICGIRFKLPKRITG